MTHFIWIFFGLGLIAAIWLPFGFSLGGLIEEWDELGLFTQHGTIFVIEPNSFLKFLRGRPLTFLPQAIAYSLDKTTFYYWHVLLIASLFIKFSASCFIGHYMSRSLICGVIIAALVLLFPADTMQINLRTLHIDWAIALAILAGALILQASHTRSVPLRLLVSIMSTALFAIGCLIYEAVLPLFLLPIAAMYVRYGLVAGARQSIKTPLVWAAWIAGLAGCVIFIAIIGQQSDSYQSSVTGAAGSFLTRPLYLLQTIVFTALYRGFWEAWSDIYTLAWARFDHRLLILPVVIFSSLLLYSLAARENADSSTAWYRKASVVRLAIAGVALFSACYSPFLLSGSHVLITQRTFLSAASGGAMAIAALILAFGLLVRSEWLTALIAGSTVSAALLAQIYQHDQYNRIYANAGRPMVQALATIASSFPPGETIPVVSRYGALSATWDFGVPTPMILAYLKPGAGTPLVCDGRTGRVLPATRPPAPTTCNIESDGLIVANPDGSRRSYKRFAVIETNGSVVVHNVDAPVSPSVQPSPVAPAVLHLGSWTPADSWFNRHAANLVYECKFESMWGYAVPCRGFGISEGEFTRNGWQKPSSFSWVMEQRAGLIVGSLATTTHYRVVVDLQNFALTPDVSATKLTLNDKPLSLKWTSPRTIEADIPPDIVIGGTDVLGLEAPLDRQHHLSIGLNHVRIFKRD